MTFGTSVKDGTGAGRKMHLKSAPKTPWTCANSHANPAFAVNCLAVGCREKRDG